MNNWDNYGTKIAQLKFRDQNYTIIIFWKTKVQLNLNKTKGTKNIDLLMEPYKKQCWTGSACVPFVVPLLNTGNQNRSLCHNVFLFSLIWIESDPSRVCALQKNQTKPILRFLVCPLLLLFLFLWVESSKSNSNGKT